ncbi:MAG TPA: PP2C family protein-serine/threonine phosphatase [Spirochaetota bacterium]|nr:PP2C family protein-serine/threonine phosphatase [Spirochaetota bacterium]
MTGMIARLFIRIYNKSSFTLAIAVMTTTWSWVASFYGFFFVYATVNFAWDELMYVLSVLIICTSVAISLHLTHFGLFHKFGFSGFSNSIRLINRYFENKYIFVKYKNLADKEIEDVYIGISGLPRTNLYAAFTYTAMVICALIVIIYWYSGEIEKVIMILAGGIFSSMIIGYCTFLLTEYFTGPYKMRLEQILFERSINVGTKNLLSFKYKSIVNLILIFLSMINLAILIWRSDKSVIVIISFIALSLITVGLLIFLMLNILRISLDTINKSTKRLAGGGSGMFFPPFTDREFTTFSENYNRAAMEINEIRRDLEKKIKQRTDELSTAYESLNKAYGQIQADLTMAKRIQKRIMPDDFESMDGVDLSVDYYPMADIGGDIYDIFLLRPGYIRIFLADAIGHGIQAALITMIIKSEYEKVKTIEDTQELLQWLNRSFFDLYISLNAFFSCILIDIDTENMKLKYSSAGHPDQIHITDGPIDILKHTGKLIGIKRDAEYEYYEKDIKSGNKILLYTDGLFEQVNKNDEGFTEQHIIELIKKNRSNPIKELNTLIIQTLRNFMGGKDEISVRDDITLIGIQIR